MHGLMATVGLVLVLEGVLPFLAPVRWRETITRLSQLRDGQIRFLGLGAILGGYFLFRVFS